MRSILTPEDMMKGESVPPGWYPAEIFDYKEEVTKGNDAKPSDGSMNAIFFFRLLDGPNKGKEMRRYFNEKALGFGKNLWSILFPNFDKKRGGELTSEMFQSSIGKKMLVYVKKGTNNYDSIEDWRPLPIAS